MALDNTNEVDAIGIEKDSGFVVLTIIDTWQWDDAPSHICALQDKFNSYLTFIESGQIWDAYPDAAGRQLVIDVIMRVPIPAIAHRFFEMASAVASQLDVVVRQQQFDEGI